MDISDIIKERKNPGILIYSMTRSLLYANKESLAFFPGLRKKEKKKSKALEDIEKLCEAAIRSGVKEDNKDCPVNSVILSDNEGFSHYVRAFHLKGAGTGISPGQIVILIEKVALKHEANFDDVRMGYALTNREAEVAKHLCAGLTDKKLAEKMQIGELTIKGHIRKLMQKMGVQSRKAIIARLK